MNALERWASWVHARMRHETTDAWKRALARLRLFHGKVNSSTARRERLSKDLQSFQKSSNAL